MLLNERLRKVSGQKILYFNETSLPKNYCNCGKNLSITSMVAFSRRLRLKTIEHIPTLISFCYIIDGQSQLLLNELKKLIKIVFPRQTSSHF